jgi:RNA polymerase sigma factor (TIGR02999 family)
MSRERPGHMLQTTALVHEAYQKLLDTPHIRWRDRTHFLAVSAQLMRRVLVDCSRSRDYLKRGGGCCTVPIHIGLIASSSRSADFSAIDDALTALARIDPRKSQMVELRFFGGLTVDETAKLMKVSPKTVMRDWQFAKVWLLRELDRGEKRAT